MKNILLSIIILLISSCNQGKNTNSLNKLSKTNDYISTKSMPVIKIESVNVPEIKTQPLELIISFRSKGISPIAISQDHLTAIISNTTEPYLFTSDVIVQSYSKPLLINSEEIKKFEALISSDRFNKKHWSSLKSGIYKLKILINSWKSKEFDYQWLGQTYSNEYRLIIK